MKFIKYLFFIFIGLLTLGCTKEEVTEKVLVREWRVSASYVGPVTSVPFQFRIHSSKTPDKSAQLNAAQFVAVVLNPGATGVVVHNQFGPFPLNTFPDLYLITLN